MKRILSILSAAFFCAAAFAQGTARLAERTYIATDKDCYVAGDRIWCSAFCVDASTGRLSDFSSIAYIELHSDDGMVGTGKIALRNGRGAGSFTIPANCPTGNYRLLAYTAQNVNEDGFDYAAGSRLVSVFNTFTTERVRDGVEIVEDEPVKDYGQGSAGIRIAAGRPADGTIGLKVTSLLAEAATVSVSVFHDDGIALPQASDIRSFSPRADVDSLTFSDVRIPEYDGEILYGRVAGIDPSRISEVEGKFAFVSVPGDRSDTYSCQIAADGSATFFTNNFYGEKDLVCQIENLDAGVGCHLEIDSPFVNVPVSGIPKLGMSSQIADALLERSVSMQIEKAFDADTLYDRMPVRDNLLFGSEGITYRLDDYTRLPLMEECITEFIQELRARKDDARRRDLQVRLQDSYRNTYFSKGASLMMVDGVPVFDHEVIYRYDPLLVETVNIYPYTYFIGTRGYNGVVNFVTYKQNLPSVKFNDDVRILEFQGASYPMAYTCADVMDSYPDYRQTIFWHPLVDLAAGGSADLTCRVPAYGGRFRVVVEGLTAQGEPVFQTAVIELK